MIRNYLANRRGFYETLLARLPDGAIRQRVEVAAEFLAADAALQAAVSGLSEDAADGFLAALKTIDLMKKPANGLELGRTTISIDEALNRAIMIEELGIILFDDLSEKYPSLQPNFVREQQTHRHSLTELLRLHDELRYHRLVLNSPGKPTP